MCQHWDSLNCRVVSLCVFARVQQLLVQWLSEPGRRDNIPEDSPHAFLRTWDIDDEYVVEEDSELNFVGMQGMYGRLHVLCYFCAYFTVHTEQTREFHFLTYQQDQVPRFLTVSNYVSLPIRKAHFMCTANNHYHHPKRFCMQ